MDVLLISPMKDRADLTVVPPLGLGYLATAFRKDGNNVTILDCQKNKFTIRKLADYVSGIDFQLIGITLCSATLQVKQSLEVIKR